LEEESAGILNTNIDHANITESNAVETFLESAILYPQLADALVAEESSVISNRYTIIGVHSPVSILVQNATGERIGVVNGEITEEIVGGSYLEFAVSKYVIVPESEEIEVILTGQATGRYSLTIEALSAEGQTLTKEILGATSTPSMYASFACLAGICSEVEVDYENDGVLDVRFDWAGGYEDLTEPELAAEDENMAESPSSGSRTGTRVRPPSQPTGQVAGITTDNPQLELEKMWIQLLEIEKDIDELKRYFLVE
jgi:hypothetical protein